MIVERNKKKNADNSTLRIISLMISYTYALSFDEVTQLKWYILCTHGSTIKLIVVVKSVMV